MSPAANSNSRLGASEAPWGVSSLDLRGRPDDWSAASFGVEDQSVPLDAKDWAFIIKVCAALALIWIAAFSAIFIGA